MQKSSKQIDPYEPVGIVYVDDDHPLTVLGGDSVDYPDQHQPKDVTPRDTPWVVFTTGYISTCEKHCCLGVRDSLHTDEHRLQLDVGQVLSVFPLGMKWRIVLP